MLLNIRPIINNTFPKVTEKTSYVFHLKAEKYLTVLRRWKPRLCYCPKWAENTQLSWSHFHLRTSSTIRLHIGCPRRWFDASAVIIYLTVANWREAGKTLWVDWGLMAHYNFRLCLFFCTILHHSIWFNRCHQWSNCKNISRRMLW